MMDVAFTHAARIAVRTLPPDERRHVEAWCERLKNWDQDDLVRKHTHKLDSDEPVFVLRTNDDMRIFFTVEQSGIVVRDIASKAAIESFASVKA